VAPVVDIHTHYVPRGWPDLGNVLGPAPDWPWLRPESERAATLMLGAREFRAVTDTAWNAQVRLADMAADGVDVQLLSPTPVFFGYHRPVDHAIGVARIFNDLAREICAEAPDRLLSLCQVPLQDPDAACAELDRCLAAGHVGVEIGNHVGDADLDDAAVVTFLQHCAGTGAAVFVHPWDMPGGPRLERWMAQWLTGMPAETHLSIVAMIFGGVFDRISADLRICFAHGGGSFAFWLGRMDNAWHRRRDITGVSEQPPSAYVDRFCVDSVVFAPAALRLLADTLGPDRILLGSDYPYPLGERPVGAVIRDSAWLTDAQRERILGGNALAFLGDRAATALAGQPMDQPDTSDRRPRQ
jgi:aminocarboxymuconate-semialdehyde decarboxylase